MIYKLLSPIHEKKVVFSIEIFSPGTHEIWSLYRQEVVVECVFKLVKHLISDS
jgi:hypothetical protein